MENLKKIAAIQASEYNTQYMGVMLISVVVAVAAVVLSTHPGYGADEVGE